MSARAEPRFTRDIDVAVMVDDDADGEGLVRSLLADRYRLLASIEQDQTGRLATVRLECPASDGTSWWTCCSPVRASSWKSPGPRS